MLNKIFIILALVCGISFANELENCVYTVSRDFITFYCDYNGGNSNYKISFDKSDITYCIETSYIGSTKTTITIRRFYYVKTVEDELGAIIVNSAHDIEDVNACRKSYDHLKSITIRNNVYN